MTAGGGRRIIEKLGRCVADRGDVDLSLRSGPRASDGHISLLVRVGRLVSC